MTKIEKWVTDKTLNEKASALLTPTKIGLFGIYGWEIKGRRFEFHVTPRRSTYWTLNGRIIDAKYVYALTYRLLNLV